LRFVSKCETLRKYLDKKTLKYTQVQCYKSGDFTQLLWVRNVNGRRDKVEFIVFVNEVCDMSEWDEIIRQ
jgi:hypothetical protein